MPDQMKVLVVNCGSSSIKYQLYAMPDNTVLAKGMVERIGDEGAALVYEHDGKSERRECAIADPTRTRPTCPTTFPVLPRR